MTDLQAVTTSSEVYVGLMIFFNNDPCSNIHLMHLTVLFVFGTTSSQAVSRSQTAFNALQTCLLNLKLNADKKNRVLSSRTHNYSLRLPTIHILNGTETEIVQS